MHDPFLSFLRAEMGRSRRHLSEFSMIEAEVAFIDDISSVVDVVERSLRRSVASVLQTNSDDVETYLNFRTTRKVISVHHNPIVICPKKKKHNFSYAS